MRSVYQSVWITSCAVVCIVGVTCDARAEGATSFQNPTGWSIGAANSTYQEWDAFRAKSGNAPDVGHFPASFTPTVSASPAIVTGTNNIYWYGGDYRWWLDIDNYGVGEAGEGTRVVVQTATTLSNGVGVYPDSLAVVRPDGGSLLGGDAASVLRETVLFQGDIWVESQGTWVTTQERLWEFFLPGYTGDFRVEGASHVHSSLMQVRVDSMIASVPEPGTIALAATGLITLGACRTVRRIRRRARSA
ncbi:MAG: PEP-CTERM sorting domain-containing protein [Pirellulales bacterium]